MTTQWILPEVSPTSFEEFWSAYPRKVGKLDAAKAFKQAMRWTNIVVILKALGEQKRSAEWLRNNGQFIPHPSTWLNQGHWSNELTKIPAGSTQLTPIEKQIHNGEYLRALDRIRTIASQYDQHQAWTEPDRKESRMLKARCQELRKMLNLTI